jgi:hypothetical protein
VEEYPINIPSIHFESNLIAFGASFKIKHLEPNTLKYDKLGLRPIHNSYDIFLMSERILTRLTMCHTVLTASAHRNFRIEYSCSMVRVSFFNVRFFLSTTIFCYGVCEVEYSCLYPLLM